MSPSEDRNVLLPISALLLAFGTESSPRYQTALLAGAGVATTTLEDAFQVGYPVGLEIGQRVDKFRFGGGGSWQTADNQGVSDARPREMEAFRLYLKAGWSFWRWRGMDLRTDLAAAWTRTTLHHSAWSGMIPDQPGLPASTSIRQDASIGLEPVVQLAPRTGGAALELVPFTCEIGTLTSCSARLSVGWTFASN